MRPAGYGRAGESSGTKVAVFSVLKYVPLGSNRVTTACWPQARATGARARIHRARTVRVWQWQFGQRRPRSEVSRAVRSRPTAYVAGERTIGTARVQMMVDRRTQPLDRFQPEAEDPQILLNEVSRECIAPQTTKFAGKDVALPGKLHAPCQHRF